MKTDKTSRYLKYAIGEIILVVIGILIALQINTWNNSNIDSRKEKEYLRNLIEDIKTQELIVNDQIAHERKMKLKCERALKHLSKTSPDADSLNYYLADITRKTFVINDPTFQDLKSSGNILLIKDNAVRKKIMTFNQKLDYSAKVIQTSNETSIAEFRDYLLKFSVVNLNFKDTIKVAGNVDWSIKTVDLPWAQQLQEDKLKNQDNLFILLNHISQRGRSSSVNLDLMERLKEQTTLMLSQIETYLND